MPGTEGLTPTLITDFSPGLYNANDWLVPAKGWQTMTDCYPQVGGGLRAFYKASSFSNSGIVHAGDEVLIGAAGYSGLLDRDNDATVFDRYISTYDTHTAGAFVPRIYRMDGTNDETTWSQIHRSTDGLPFASTASATPGKTSFRIFMQTNGDLHMLIVLRYAGSNNGLWRVLQTDLSSSDAIVHDLNAVLGDAFGIKNGAIAIHAAKVVIGTGNGEIFWSNNGADGSWSAANFIPLDPNKDGARIRGLIGVEPSDLIAFREGAGFVVVQGDITSNPAVQVQQGGILIPKFDFDPCDTPMGVVIISEDGYMFLTDGRTNQNISQQLTPFTQSNDFNDFGSTVFTNEFIFGPRGRIYHVPTKSWFLQTQLAGSVKALDTANTVWGNVADGASFNLATLSPQNDSARVSSFTAKTAPIHGTDGRQVDIRQVDVYCKNYEAQSSVTVTVAGHAVTKYMRSTGAQTLRFLFEQRKENLDVTFASNAPTLEAPSFDSVQLWSRAGHLLPN
jgi:hypothetical protein